MNKLKAMDKAIQAIANSEPSKHREILEQLITDLIPQLDGYIGAMKEWDSLKRWARRVEKRYDTLVNALDSEWEDIPVWLQRKIEKVTQR